MNLCCSGQSTRRRASRALPASQAQNITRGKISWDLIAAVIEARRGYNSEVFGRSRTFRIVAVAFLFSTVIDLFVFRVKT